MVLLKHKKKNSPTAVIVGLSVNSLCIVRSLGRRGIPVIAFDSNFSTPAAKTKYCKKIIIDNPYDNTVIDELITIGKSFDRKGVLFCNSDLTILSVSDHEEELKNYYDFVFPSRETIDILINKRLFYDFALKHNLNVPKTYFTNSREAIESISYSIPYPIIIKPEFRDSDWDRLVPDKKTIYAHSRTDCLKICIDYNITEKPLILQEWIEGGDADVFFCLTYINRKGIPLAVFTGRKIRQYPILTGVTSFAESIWLEHIANEALHVLEKAQCTGICSVEFKRSLKDTTYKITEPTVCRTDLQEGVSVSSGMDIPYLAYLDAIGREPYKINNFKQNIKWINEPYDYYSVQNYLITKKMSFKDIILSYKGNRSYALSSFYDPLPIISFLFRKLALIPRKIIKLLK